MRSADCFPRELSEGRRRSSILFARGAQTRNWHRPSSRNVAPISRAALECTRTGSLAIDRPLSSQELGGTHFRKTAASGGSVSAREYGRPWDGTGAASRPPEFPQLLPPYDEASLFKISFQKPLCGTPT